MERSGGTTKDQTFLKKQEGDTRAKKIVEEEHKIRKAGGTPSKEFVDEKKRLEREKIETRRAAFKTRKQSTTQLYH